MFAPLRIKTGYSFLKSALSVEKAVNIIAKNKYQAAGIIDENVLFGLPSFFHALLEKNIKPVGGMEIKINEYLTICLLIENENGYLNLCQISSLISEAKFDFDFLKKHGDGLIAILSTTNELIQSKFKEDELSFRKEINDLSKIFSSFYIGLEISNKNEKEFANTLRQFVKTYDYKLVCFPTILYEKKEDAIALDIVNAINKEETLVNKKREGYQCFLSNRNYEILYSKEEISAIDEIISKINFNLFIKRGELISSDIENVDEYLKNKCLTRLKELDLIKKEGYLERLNYELDCIKTLNFSNYFLVVSDYVNFAKQKDILVGPGRGSAVGSLVSYLLNITDVDPLVYNLQFERFLNINRKSMPDIDVDFQDTRRDEIVQYLREKYGNDKVSNIVTFQTILAKQALRDVGRVFNYKNQHIDYLCKLLINKDYSLRQSYQNIPAFKKIIDSDKYFLEIVSLASKIEFLPRQNGIHAAGVILNNKPIVNSLPLIYDFEDNSISQYEKNYLEEQGFLKMDILGLRNLTIISQTVDLINKNGKILDKWNIPYDDSKLYELINSLQTTGIFQLESSGMKRAIKQLKPSCFLDVVALLALFRPGPMKFIPIYAERKQNPEKVTYISNEIKKILSPTYGIIVYQEQVNEIATSMAAFSKEEADIFRRAISKKDKETMHALKEKFILGSVDNGYTKLDAEKMFDNIDKFAGYGFNKSHAVAYAKLAMEMAYLKYYYPKEFYVSILQSSSSTNDIKFNDYLVEMRKRNIKILPPSVNKSKEHFTIEDNSLLFPLSQIKGINSVFASNLIQEREENGLFKDFYSFILRMSQYKISEPIALALINSGALDEFSNSRESLRLSLKGALQRVKLLTNANGQIDIGLDFHPPRLIEAHDDEMENLNLEYDALGLMLSKNPLSYKKDILDTNKVTPINEATELNKKYVLAGVIRSIKTINSKNNKPMAFVKIYDESGEIELIIFPSVFAICQPLLIKNNLILAKGKNDLRNDEMSFLVDSLKTLEE